ncbi:flagellar hook-length control protein FliK [Halarcobacter bivalviorum]|uniref:flagellar hook-length control protein FliK n=1 Tax=Halarcobacter bivalviorum TaxID=663364 RepID=UPI00100BDD32|nr:flagellar hook-length control protein FliK [Halarcobacter bivalviorum]RXK07935.1 flagellar hook-length control protein FliK [Halarcobacter bivalviorum]
MLVSNNNLLKILLPSNNKVLSDALKQADVKTLSNIKNGEVTVEDILKNLFNQAKVGAKTNSSIETLLKNSTVFKDLGSFSKNIESLLKNPTNNETIQKFKPLLENFLKNLTNLDEKSLKSSLDKSGIFLESKMLAVAEAKTSLPKNLENLLNQIKTILKDIELPQAKNISQLIDKILSQNKKGQEANLSENVKDLKTLTQQLDTIGKSLQNKQTANLEQLTSNLKNISNQIQLTQSKIDNGSVNQIETLIHNKTENLAKTKDLLLNLKGEILQNNNIPNKQTLLTQIDNLLQSKEFTTKTTSTLNNNILPQDKQFSETISNLKNVLSSLQNRQIVSTERIENILQNLSSQIQTNPVKNEVQSQIKDLLLNLKNEILLDKNIPNKQAVLTQLDNLLQNKNLDSTSLKPLINNLSSNLDSLIKNLKTTIEQMNLGNTNQNSFEKINKTLVRLEQTIENFTQNLNRNEKPQNSSTTLQNDMKTVLLKMQEELVNNPDAKVAENSKQIDKIITQIEYHQLLSLVSNSNNVYIPFIWDILEDGSISMREGKDEKFYCEINLNLKEFGETRLLLGLYDKNKLDLTVYASKEHFKKAIQENIYKLKRALNSVELIPVNIHILNFENEKKEEVKKTDIYTQNSDNLSFGIDIKV